MQSRRNTLLCHYRYDALDRLIANELPSAPERHRFYCKSRLATEIQGVNRYSLLQHGDQILAQQQSEGDALSTTLLATDQQRSVLQTLNANQTQQPVAYTPYGHHHPENGLLSLLGFNGERPDPVTGCYLLGNGYRAFNPVLMRFNCPDSWSPFRRGGLNSYAYCLGDPVNREDSNGHISFYITVKLVAWRARAIARVAATHQFKKLMRLSSENSPLPPPANASKKLEAAKNNSISLKKAALLKVKNLGFEPEAPQPQAFKDAKADVANIDANLDAARKRYATERLEFEFVRLGRLGIEGRAAHNPGATGELPPLSPTSQKLVFDNLDKWMDSAIANLRQN
jgi:RHS repeat-associated protein